MYVRAYQTGLLFLIIARENEREKKRMLTKILRKQQRRTYHFVVSYNYKHTHKAQVEIYIYILDAAIYILLKK